MWFWKQIKITTYYYFRPWQNFKRLKRAFKDDFSDKEYDDYVNKKAKK